MRYICGGGCQAWNNNKTSTALTDPPTFCDGQTSYYFMLAQDKLRIALELFGIKEL